MKISSTQINHWAATRAAQDQLPALVRRLLRSTTPGLSRLEFPAGDAVHLPGFDGLSIAAESTPWCPVGPAVWEMGCNADPRRKADGDWEKRLQETDPAARAERAFVFVTPRNWPAKRAWLEARQAEGAWREVRAFDASDLEAWLEASLATSIWFSEHIGLPSDLGSSGPRWLRSWLSATTPQLSGDILLWGRDAQVARLIEVLRDPSTRALSIVGDDRGEAIAFLVAALERAEASDLLDRLIISRTPQRIPPMEGGIRPLVVADLERDEGEPPNLAEVSVVRAYPRGRLNERADIDLPHLPASALEGALEALGLTKTEAERRVGESGASLTVIRRRLADDPAVRTPVWASAEEAVFALPMVLAGSWREAAPADLDALALLADRPWEHLQDDLARIKALPEAPVLNFGRTWVTVSQVDALFALGNRITPKQLDDFFGVLEQVYTERDPALDLPVEERWMANVMGKQRPFSETLVQGLGDTLCLFAIHGDAICGRRLDIDLQVRANEFVRRMLASLTREQWLSRRRLLRALAEASPPFFLDALEVELSRPEPAIEAIMGSVRGGISGECLRTDLLWALETLARCPAHVRRVAEILQDLCGRFEVDDNWANKPFASLLSLFRAWLPMAPLDVDGRVALLRHVFARDRTTGFRLCLDLLPSRGHESASDFAKPRWRPYRAGWPKVTNGERWMMEDAARELLAGAAPYQASELVELTANLESFRPEQQVLICGAAEAWAREGADEREIARVQDAIRGADRNVRFDLINRGDMPEGLVEHLEHVDMQLSRLMAALTPASPAARHAWLFKAGYTEWHDADSDVVDDDWRRGAERLQAARHAAVAEVFAIGGIPAVTEFAAEMEDPGRVGEAFVGLESGPEALTELISRAIVLPQDMSRALLRGILWSLSGDGLEHLALELNESPALSPTDLRRVAEALPGRPEGWRAAASLGADQDRAYWSSVAIYGWVLDGEDAEYAASRLLAAERPRTAFAAFGHGGGTLAARTWVQVLRAILANQEPNGPTPELYRLQRVLSELDEAPDVHDDEIALLEFPFAAAFRSERGRELALHRRMRDDPEQFVEFVRMAFRAEDGSEYPGTTSAMASVAWSLLASWRSFPGMNAEGRIEPECFQAWNTEVRRRAADAGRDVVADIRLGEAYGHAEAEPDGAWPPRAIRDLLDGADAKNLRRGFATGVYNSRGVVSKAAYEGGAQERALADQYHSIAEELMKSHPRLAQAVLNIGEGYRREAEAADQQAAVRERWER